MMLTVNSSGMVYVERYGHCIVTQRSENMFLRLLMSCEVFHSPLLYTAAKSLSDTCSCVARTVKLPLVETEYHNYWYNSVC